MKVGQAILTTIGILILMIIINSIFGARATALILWGTSIWAAVDAHKIGLKKYKVSGPTGAVSTLILCLLLWIIVFPWYLVNKGKIARGEAKLKE